MKELYLVRDYDLFFGKSEYSASRSTKAFTLKEAQEWNESFRRNEGTIYRLVPVLTPLVGKRKSNTHTGCRSKTAMKI